MVMMVPRLPFAALLLCVATSNVARVEACRNESFKGATYIVCSFDPTKDGLRMYWAADDGRPYRTFAALANDLKSKGKLLRFAMNGGVYQGENARNRLRGLAIRWKEAPGLTSRHLGWLGWSLRPDHALLEAIVSA